MSSAYGFAPLGPDDVLGAVLARRPGLGESLAATAQQAFGDTTPGMLFNRLALPPPTAASATGQLNPAMLPDTARAVRDAEAARGRRAMSLDEWQGSAFFRPDLEFDPFMTEDRARAVALTRDERKWREHVAASRDAGVFETALQFAVGLGVSLPDPINFVPLVGPAWRAAFVAKATTRAAMIARSALVSAGEGLLGTAALEPLMIADRAYWGDSTGFADVAMDLAIGAILPGAIGAGGAWWASRGGRQWNIGPAERGRQEALRWSIEATSLDDMIRTRGLGEPPPPLNRAAVDRAAFELNLAAGDLAAHRPVDLRRADPRVLAERERLGRAYDSVRADARGEADDPLVLIRPDDIEHSAISRGGWKGLGDVTVRGAGWGLVKFIWRHGENSPKAPADRITRDDVIRFPDVIREHEARPLGEQREWVVERADGKRVVYVDSPIAGRPGRRVVTIHTLDDPKSKELSPRRDGADPSGVPASRFAGANPDTAAPPSDSAGAGTTPPAGPVSIPGADGRKPDSQSPDGPGAENVGEGTGRGKRRPPPIAADASPGAARPDPDAAVQETLAEPDRDPLATAVEKVKKLAGARQRRERPPADRPAEALPATDRAFGPDGLVVDVAFEVVDAATLVTSNLDDLTVNPEFPAELQPRDRSRAASGEQVQRLAANLEPALLGRSATVADGAPIVGPDGVVESGNGRVMAIRRAYGQGLESAAAYRAWLEGQGFDLAGMTAPVLIRRRTTDMSPAERQAFTRAANERSTASLSAAEQARSDGGQLDADLLGLLRSSDVGAAANRPFVRQFLGRIAGEAELASLVDKSGALSLDGKRRIRGALLARAYDDMPTVERLLEEDDAGLGPLGRALLDVAPEWAKLADPDSTAALMDAVRAVARQRDDGQALHDPLRQGDMLGGGLSADGQAFLASFLAFGRTGNSRLRGRDRLREALGDYLEEAGKRGEGADLLGQAPARPGEILNALAARRGAEAFEPLDLGSDIDVDQFAAARSAGRINERAARAFDDAEAEIERLAGLEDTYEAAAFCFTRNA